MKSFAGLFLFLFLIFGVSSCAGSLMPGGPPAADPVLPALSPRIPAPLPVSGDDAVDADTYTIAVSNAPVRQLLEALARDADRNIDIDPQVRGRVSINAVAQPLDAILERIAAQAPVRYLRRGGELLVLPDSVYVQSYRVDYVNMQRQTVSSIAVATEIATVGGGGGGIEQGSEAGNRSRTQLLSTAQAGFWHSLEKSIRGLINNGASDPGKDTRVSVNSVSGVVTVHARYRQHRRIQRLLRLMQERARRQVLIEASIVEVELADRWQSGVDWQHLGRAGDGRLELLSRTTGGALQGAPYFLLNYAGDGGFGAAIRLLQIFGDVSVLSNPKIMALNNQTALLKVVDEKVYFTVDREESRNSDGVLTGVSYNSSVHTVPVGLVLSVTPQITDGDVVSMIIRPSISRITGYATDPAPRLAEAARYDNLIPEIQVREMESMLAVASGRTVVLGGLMQNHRHDKRAGVPGLSALPLLGRLFSYKDQGTKKTELIIMLRPQVVAQPLAADPGGDDVGL